MMREFDQVKRVEYAKSELGKLGFSVYDLEGVEGSAIWFMFNGRKVTVYPYTGWFTGKTVKDGRGIKNLLKQVS